MDDFLIKQDLHGDKIIRFAKLLIRNFEDFQKIAEKENLNEN